MKNDPIALRAADILEPSALVELKEAWLSGEIMSAKAITLNFDPPLQFPLTNPAQTPVQKQVDSETESAAPEVLEETADKKEAGGPQDLGELPQAFKGTSKTVYCPTARKLWRKKAESLGLTQTELAKKVGLKTLGSMMALRVNMKRVSSQYADFLVTLLGPEVLA